jgi:hypothetical protein
MMDIQILEQQILGITARLQQLRDAKTLFDRAAGLDGAMEKARQDRGKAEANIIAAKARLSELQSKKSASLKATVESLSHKMSEVLPSGRGIFEIGDDGLFIGWEKPDGHRVPWAGLSGGEKNPFESALSNALMGGGEKIICIEAAESDQEHLEALLDHLAKTPEDTQVVVSTWSRPREIGNWHIVEIGVGHES